MTDTQNRFRVPHPLVLLTGCVILAAMASYVLPAGEFDRRPDEATGRTVVVAGTYEQVERTPVNLFDAMVALPRGMADAGSVIFLVFLIGGAFTVVDETGALRRGVSSLIHALDGRDLLVIPAVSLFFAIGGVVQNMQEEIIPLIPVVLIVTPWYLIEVELGNLNGCLNVLYRVFQRKGIRLCSLFDQVLKPSVDVIFQPQDDARSYFPRFREIPFITPSVYASTAIPFSKVRR